MEVRISNNKDTQYIPLLLEWYNLSAQKRGIGIAKRDPDYLAKKMENGNAIIAFNEGQLAGFCYIEVFEEGKYAVNSGLIVEPEFRELGFGRKVKLEAFKLSREKYPNAKIFGITTNLSIMKINSALGYETVTFSELTNSDAFWKGCNSCKYHHILEENERKMCLCTGMVFNPAQKHKDIKTIEKQINKQWKNKK